MKRMSQLAIGVTMFAVSQIALAHHDANVFGAPTCSQWMQFTSKDKKKWLLGFLAGMRRGYAINHKGHDPLEKIESDNAIFDWMDAYCGVNPQSDISDGGFALFKELKAR